MLQRRAPASGQEGCGFDSKCRPHICENIVDRKMRRCCNQTVDRCKNTKSRKQVKSHRGTKHTNTHTDAPRCPSRPSQPLMNIWTVKRRWRRPAAHNDASVAVETATLPPPTPLSPRCDTRGGRGTQCTNRQKKFPWCCYHGTMSGCLCLLSELKKKNRIAQCSLSFRQLAAVSLAADVNSTLNEGFVQRRVRTKKWSLIVFMIAVCN